jgi:hypothetical protein
VQLRWSAAAIKLAATPGLKSFAHTGQLLVLENFIQKKKQG